MPRLSDISIQYLKGVGPARKKLFENLGISTLEDFVYFFPRRYEDRTQLTPLSQVKLGEYQTVTGKVAVRGSRRSWYSKKHVYELVIEDGRGRIFAVWFNQAYLAQYFHPGQQVILYGKVDMYKNRLQMVAPEYELIDSEEDQALSMGRIVPIYPLTRGVTQRFLRKMMRACLDQHGDEMTDILPVWLRNKHQLTNIKSSIENIHFPATLEAQTQAHRRVSFEEFFLFQLSVIKRRESIVQKTGVAHQINLDLVNEYSRSFPFSLTSAQARVIREIAADMQKSSPMLRLLQGDVGCGKTIVALFGCVAAARNGQQAALMAPTEILARQHYQTITKILNQGPFKNIRVALLLSSLRNGEKDEVHARLKKGEVDIVVGTHALLSEAVGFARLSFVVIDEQHKFGVKQRALLSSKGTNPDVLVMTATPIPRTLSLTLFGDLDVSTIDELPKGRGQITTRHFSSEHAPEVYKIAREKVETGEQVYIVYPIIAESEKLDLKAAETMYKHFEKNEFKGLKLGLIHGQMKKEDGDEVMARFKKGEIQILVATTVLEVGVDVPNANVMIVEHAERFGLSQLHQLRGRIGRGSKDGSCFLIADPVTEESFARLRAIAGTTDGFKIAEQDLLIRGPGHYFGRHQHGLNELRFANPATELDILQLARQEAVELLHQDPAMRQLQNHVLRMTMLQRYPNYLDYVEAG